MSHCLAILKMVLMILQNNMYGYRNEAETFAFCYVL